MEVHLDNSPGSALPASAEGLAAIEAEFLQQALPPAPGDTRVVDERIMAYSQAMLGELQRTEPGVVRKIFGQVLDYRRARGQPIDSASHVHNKSLRSLQAILLAESEDNSPYPQEATSPDWWTEVGIKPLLGTRKSPQLQTFILNMAVREVASNISERGKSFKLIAQLLRKRVGENPTVLDIGASQNQILKKLMLNHLYPFDPVTIRRFQTGSSTSDLEIVEDPGLTTLVNSLLASDMAFGQSVGADISLQSSEAAKQWAKSCSFYPSELLIEALVRTYDELNNADVDNLLLAHADFTAKQPELKAQEWSEQLLVPGDKRFDMVIMSTVLYQLTPTQRLQMYQNALTRLKRQDKGDTTTGLLILQDFADVDPHDPSRLVFPSSWFAKPYQYKTFVVDPEHPEKGFQEFARWINGRCGAAILGEMALDLLNAG